VTDIRPEFTNDVGADAASLLVAGYVIPIDVRLNLFNLGQARLDQSRRDEPWEKDKLVLVPIDSVHVLFIQLRDGLAEAVLNPSYNVFGLRHGPLLHQRITSLLRVRTCSRRHVEQIVPHPMIRLGFLQGTVMHHDHFVLVALVHGETLWALINLMR
jgi:hypothetical protein